MAKKITVAVEVGPKSLSTLVRLGLLDTNYRNAMALNNAVSDNVRNLFEHTLALESALQLKLQIQFEQDIKRTQRFIFMGQGLDTAIENVKLISFHDSNDAKYFPEKYSRMFRLTG